MGEGLHLVTIEITGNCNLSCDFCYRKNDPKLELENYNILLNNLAEMKPYYINISGGEPLVSKSLFMIANELRPHCSKLLLTTNGTLIRNYPANLYKVFDYVQISLDGNEKTHDNIRGKGTFVEIKKGAEYLRGIVPVSFQCTVNKSNIMQLNSIIQTGKEVGALPKISRMCGMGNGKLKPLDQPLKWKDILKSGIDAKMLNDDPLSFWFNQEKRNNVSQIKFTGGCTAGVAGVAISPSLNVFPCVKLRISAGNLKTQSLKDIWLNSPLFSNLRDWDNLKGKCKVCDYKSICRGCRADAWLRDGDYLGDDPFNNVYKKDYQTMNDRVYNEILNYINNNRNPSTLVLTGGEPFLDDRLEEIVHYASNNNWSISIDTWGGWDKEPNLLQGFQQIRVRLVSFNHYKNAYLMNDYDCDHKISQLVAKTKQYYHGSKILVFPLCSVNSKEIDTALEWCKENDYRANFSFVPYGHKYGFKCNEYHKILKRLSSLQHYSYIPDAPLLALEGIENICTGGRISMFVDVDGGVRVCPYFSNNVTNICTGILESWKYLKLSIESLNEDCRKCDMYTKCGGGCLANKSYNGKDLYCVKN